MRWRTRWPWRPRLSARETGNPGRIGYNAGSAASLRTYFWG